MSRRFFCLPGVAKSFFHAMRGGKNYNHGLYPTAVGEVWALFGHFSMAIPCKNEIPTRGAPAHRFSITF